MKKIATLDRHDKEGHGEDGPKPSVSKGTYTPVGTAAPLAHEAIGVNKKSGHTGGGEV